MLFLLFLQLGGIQLEDYFWVLLFRVKVFNIISPVRKSEWRFRVLIVFLSWGLSFFSYSQPCDPTTPTFNVDLTGNPDSSWLSPDTVRIDHCCSASGSDRCVEFWVTLDPGAQGIQFEVASGAIPPGALFYEIGCANPTQVGDTLCLTGSGPHRITFCKPGNNKNVYRINSIPAPLVSPPTSVGNGCSSTIYATGLDPATIHWEAVPTNATFDSFLSCQDGCDTVLVTALPGYPAFVDYQVEGMPIGGCNSISYTDTVRVFFVTDKFADIQPQFPVVCFGGTNTSITANGIGGAPPYSYLWNTGETTQSISVGVGTYSVQITDTTDCPPVGDTVTVTANPSPISVNAGADVYSCANNTSATLNGSVNMATGGVWSGGLGSYAPTSSTLNATYTPTPAEISAGSVFHVLTTTGNNGCPAESDTVQQFIIPSPTIDAGPNQVVCADANNIALSGSSSNTGGIIWTGSGDGTFSNSTIHTPTYFPGSADSSNGSVTLTITSTNNGSCLAVSDVISITFTTVPTVSAGTDQNLCASISGVSLGGSVTVASGGNWTTSGTGTFVPSSSDLNASYQPGNADTASGSVVLTLTTTGNGNCNAYSDNLLVTFNPVPVVNAGSNQSICADEVFTNLNGSVSNAGGGIWTTSGSGTFSPSSTNLNATYSPSPQDTTNGSVTLTLTSSGNGVCSATMDQTIISITPAPFVYSGMDTIICKDASSLQLNGIVYNTSGAVWSTTGSGSFSPSNTSINAVYQPLSGDTALGNVTLTLTTNAIGGCSTYSDQFLVTFSPVPIISAGNDISVCAGSGAVSISGSVLNANGGTWTSSGTGTFSSPNSLITNYSPSTSDTANGFVNINFTSTGNGGCASYTDQMVISFSPRPVIDAGTDISICADAGSVSLNANMSNAGGVLWTTSGTGSFQMGSNSLANNYLPSNADTANSVVLYISTTSNGLCSAVSDSLIINFVPSPYVSAGSAINICADAISVNLSGTYGNAGGIIWSSSGSGSFSPNSTTPTSSYIPDSTDVSTGSVTLTLTTSANGICSAYSSTVLVNFIPAPIVDAGPDQTICADYSGVVLGGSVTNAGGGIWTTNGTGVFSPGATALNSTYIPGNADTASGLVTLILTSTQNGTCNSYRDTLAIYINPAPVALAGSDVSVCSNNASVSLNASVFNAAGGQWTSTGTGSFVPGPNSLNTTYFPSNSDTAAGFVGLILNTTGNGLCSAVADTVDVIITPFNIQVFAGIDSLVCESDTLPLNGLVTIASGGQWTSMGDGFFFPNDSSLNTQYVFGINDTTSNQVLLFLTSTGNGGCNARVDSVLISIQDPLSVQLISNDTACDNQGSVNLSLTTNTGQGFWSSSGDGNFSPDSSIINGNYLPGIQDTINDQVTLWFTTANNGVCSARSDSLFLTLLDPPSIQMGSNATCEGQPNIFGSSVFTFGNVASYLWDFGDGNFDSSQFAVHQYASAGTYNTELLVISDYGCKDSVTATAIVNPLPIPDFETTAFCYVDTVWFNDASSISLGSITNYNWNLGDGTLVGGNVVGHVYNNPGSYNVLLILTSDQGCLDSVASAIDVHPSPVSGFNSLVVCEGDLTVFQSASAISDGSINYFLWSTDGVNLDSNVTSTYTYNTYGWHIVQHVVESDFGCRDTVVDSVYVYPNPVSSFFSNNFCMNDSTAFVNTSSVPEGNILNYNWSFGDGVNSTQLSPFHVFTSVGNYMVNLIVTSDGNCQTESIQTITINPNPLAAFWISDTIVFPGQNLDLYDQSSGMNTWFWDFDDGNTFNISQPQHFYEEGGTYSINLIVTNEFQCDDTASQDIIVTQPPDIPTAFTPNGDGRNDYFRVLGGPYVEYNLTIFNNWGESIFNSKNQSEWWDGTKMGVEQPVGVYVYMFYGKTEDNQNFDFHGDITLIR